MFSENIPTRDALPGVGVAALLIPNGNSRLTRREIDAYADFVGNYGAKGLAYIKVNDLAAGREGLQSPIVKNLPDDVLQSVMQRIDAKDGDLLGFQFGLWDLKPNT